MDGAGGGWERSRHFTTCATASSLPRARFSTLIFQRLYISAILYILYILIY